MEIWTQGTHRSQHLALVGPELKEVDRTWQQWHGVGGKRSGTIELLKKEPPETQKESRGENAVESKGK